MKLGIIFESLINEHNIDVTPYNITILEGDIMYYNRSHGGEGYNVYYTINANDYDQFGSNSVKERLLLNPKPFKHSRAANNFAHHKGKDYGVQIVKDTWRGLATSSNFIEILKENIPKQ